MWTSVEFLLSVHTTRSLSSPTPLCARATLVLLQVSSSLHAICLCVFVCIYMCICGCLWICVHEVRRPKVDIKCLSQHPSPNFFNRCVVEPRDWQFSWMTRNSSASASRALDLLVCAATPGFHAWLLELELRSSCLMKQAPYWLNYLPSPCTWFDPTHIMLMSVVPRCSIEYNWLNYDSYLCFFFLLQSYKYICHWHIWGGMWEDMLSCGPL